LRTVSLTLAGLTIAIALWHQLAPQISLKSSPFADNGKLITSYLRAGVRTQFAGDGKPADVLAINKAERIEGSDETALSGIQFFSQSKDGAKWHIDSTFGLFFEKTNELFLDRGVSIQEASRNGTMRTESMWLSINDKRATGDREVVLTSPGSRTLGTGFELDLATDIATLKGRVKTDYE